MMHMRFTGKDGSFETNISPEVVEALEEHRWLADEREEDETIRVSAATLRDEVDRTLRELKADPKYTYVTSEIVSTPRGPVKHECSGGWICGIHINGNIFHLETGYDHCVLCEIKEDAEGMGCVASRQDIRDWEFIDTDSHGRITIRKRRATGPVARWLRRIRKKIETWTGEVHIEVA